MPEVTPDYTEAQDDTFSLTLTGGEETLVSWTMRFDMKFGPEFGYSDSEAVFLGQQIRQQFAGFFPLESENSMRLLEGVILHVRGVRERNESSEGTAAPTPTCPTCGEPLVIRVTAWKNSVPSDVAWTCACPEEDYGTEAQHDISSASEEQKDEWYDAHMRLKTAALEYAKANPARFTTTTPEESEAADAR